MKPAPGKANISLPNGSITRHWLEWFADLKRILFDGLAASRIVATNANNELVDVANLTDWIAGTSGEIIVTDDTDGTVTLSLTTKDFGNIQAADVSDNLTTVAINTWYQIVSFNAEGSSVNMDPVPADDHIIVAHSGFYLMGYSFSGHCAADHDFKVRVCKNNNAYGWEETTGFLSTNVVDQVYTVTGSSILYLLENDTVELWIKRTSAGDNIVITVDYLNLWLQLMVGM